MAKEAVANLDDRIIAAFTDTAKSEDFEPLLRDVEFSAKTANDKAAAARERALDPLNPAKDVAAARAELDDATFASGRLQAAVKRLTARHRVVKANEENARRSIIYNEVLLARDQLAAELASTYPPLAAKLAELLQKIDANNRDIATLKPPDGAGKLLSAELMARNMLGFVNNGITSLSLVEDTRLPAWRFDIHEPFTWPQSAARGQRHNEAAA